jgi:phosphoglycolate phosphatase-like HAD superfamily hydrolase
VITGDSVPSQFFRTIGDTIYDYLAGVNAKVHTGLVAWSSKSFEDSVKPSLWVKSFDDILTYLYGHR